MSDRQARKFLDDYYDSFRLPPTWWHRLVSWEVLLVWTAAVVGGVAYYAYWQGHFEALRLTGCAM